MANKIVEHINIYGPPASGKTRYADQLQRHYRCVKVIDEGKIVGPPVIDARERTLILTQQPIHAKGVRTIRIDVALVAANAR